ncbi:MAG: hypothetical protein M5U14_00870 [Acidimicrobiia bacterium]|nr:hypothetical protein [Acidimicrobiia bacterium]
MDLLTAVKIIFRRWAVVLPVLLLTVAAAFLISTRISPTYSARGSVVFLPPSEGGAANPWSGFNPALQTTATLIGQVLDADDQRQAFLDEGLSGEYRIVAPYDPTRAVLAPTLELSVDTTDPEVALATIRELVTRIQTELEDQQEDSGASEDTWIQSRALTVADQAVEQNTARYRVLAIVVLLGGAAAVSLAFVLESFDAGRRRRLEEAAGPGEGDDEGAPEESEPAGDTMLPVAGPGRPRVRAEPVAAQGRSAGSGNGGQAAEPSEAEETARSLPERTRATRARR